MGKLILSALFAFGGWLFSEVAYRALLVGVLYVVISYLMPFVWNYAAPFLGASSLTSLFNAIPDSVFFFMLGLRMDVGVPLIISAYVARFLIRRLPLVG